MELLYQLSYNGLGFGAGGELLYQLSPDVFALCFTLDEKS